MRAPTRGTPPDGAPRAPSPSTRTARLPLILAVTAALALIGIVVPSDPWLSAALVALAPFAAVAAVTDAGSHRIPTRATLGAGVVSVLVLGVGAAVDAGFEVLIRAAVAAVVVGVLYLLLWRFASLGWGDVRLAPALAFVAGWSGWPTTVLFVAAAHVLVLAPAVWHLARGRRGRYLPFAPFLVAGLYLAVTVHSLAG